MSEEIRDILPEDPFTENPELPEVPVDPSDEDESNENSEEPESPKGKVYTIADYLQGISELLTEKTLRVILAKRHLKADIPIEELEEKEMDLAEAEVYYHLSNLPVGGQQVKDVDGSWSHSEGGWTVSKANIEEWFRKYSALREKWGEEVVTKSRIRIINL